MKAKRNNLAAIAFIILLAVVLGIYAVRSADYAPENPLSATAKTPLGINALYLLLREEGLKADFFGQDLTLLPPDATLVVGDDAPATPIASAVEKGEIWRTASENGHTVIYMPAISGKNFTPFARQDSAAKDAAASASPVNYPSEPRAKLPKGVIAYDLPWLVDETGYMHINTAGIASPLFAGVNELQAGGLSPLDLKPLAESKDLLPSAREVYYFKGTDRPFLVISQLNNGTWVQANAAELFTNRDIGRADNAVFAYNLMSREAKGELWFLESIHGYAAQGVGPVALLFFSWWGQLILLAAICGVLFLLPVIFPLGKDIETSAIVFPPTLERVRAQAEIWRHSKQQREALAFALTNGLGLSGDDRGLELARWLEEEGVTPAKAKLLAQELIAGQGRLSPEALRAYDRIMRRHIVIRRYM
jgi:hypothetical protein